MLRLSASFVWKSARLRQSAASVLSMPRLLATIAIAALLSSASFCQESAPAVAPQGGETLPLSDVKPGMQGYAYTIFAGDQVEKFDLEVIGVMPNSLGPKQSIILVQLKGAKVEHTGVVAGMSGSPVYLNGKLAGALSLKLGIFTKEPIAGVTPIQDILHPAGPNNTPPVSAAMQPQTQPSSPTYSSTQVQSQSLPQQVALPRETASRNGLPSG